MKQERLAFEILEPISMAVYPLWVPPEVWNRLGTTVLAKLRSGADLRVGVNFSVTLDVDLARSMQAELYQILDDLGLADKVEIRDS